MAADPKEKLELVHGTEEATTDAREVYLRDGRTLSVSTSGSEELVEIRAASGVVEVRIRMTEQGPVLQMESVRLQLKASEAVEVEARQFSVKTEDAIALETRGRVTVKSEGDTDIAAEGEVHVNGEKIWLN